MLGSCAACTLNDGCGWCGADNTCVSDADHRRLCTGPEAQYVRAVETCDSGLNAPGHSDYGSEHH